jgi:predicted O-methyltransferase YrrM
MTTPFSRLATQVVSSPLGWRLIDGSLLRIARYAVRIRHGRPRLDTLLEDIVRHEMPDLTVRHGPFAGLRYPRATSSGSTLFPKLLGSYERELHEVLRLICTTTYTDVVDIGGAEGYYAIGLARAIPSARVWAFDTDARALASCREMAVLNQVAARVTTSGVCTPDTLAAMPLGRFPLIICDCEGYEARLFTDATVHFLLQSDLLIETHDFLDISISRTVCTRFAATHDVAVIRSIDDITKAHCYEYAELANYELPTRKLLLAERRPAIMEWLWLTSRARRGNPFTRSPEDRYALADRDKIAKDRRTEGFPPRADATVQPSEPTAWVDTRGT